MIVCGVWTSLIAATIHDLFLFLQQFHKLRYKKNLNITLALKRNQFSTSLKLSRHSNIIEKTEAISIKSQKTV